MQVGEFAVAVAEVSVDAATPVSKISPGALPGRSRSSLSPRGFSIFA
jgi:hypothetical protein